MKKIRIAALIVTVLAVLLLASCDIDLSGMYPTPTPSTHTCDFKLNKDLSVPATCTAYGKEVYKCSCGETKEEILDPIDHTPALIPEKPVTCTEDGSTEGSYCSVCKTVLTATEVIRSEGHTVVIDPATESVGNLPAKTEGKHCSACGLVIVKQEFVFPNNYANPESYDSSYALEYLKSLPKGKAYETLYNRIDAEADYFHASSIDAPLDFVIAKVKYSDLGITDDEAIAVWTAYKTDRPLYYWMSDQITYTKDEISLIVPEEFQYASVRESTTSTIYDRVEDFVEEIETDDPYLIALYFHDVLVGCAEYRYEEDGVTPSDDFTAHNIIGVFLELSGVCESYAKTFQLLLNYCGINNVIVTGYAGEAHAWNMVELGDGNWYLCDLTWDDTPEFMLGVSHRYFMVTETEDLSGQDGPWLSSAVPFGVSHTPDEPSMDSTAFAYTLPTVSTEKYETEGFKLRSEFTIDGLTYAVIGYNSAALVRIEKDGDINVPATVTFEGIELSVTTVGAMENGYFTTKSIAIEYDASKSYPQRNIEVINLPETVVFIWDNAFVLDSLKEINVVGDNSAFASMQGVLFTKDLKVLVKYPSGRTETEFSLPEETEYIAEGAFSMFYSNIDLQLEKIWLGESFILAGFANRGYGYDEYDEAYNASEGEMDRIKEFLSGSKTVVEYQD